MLHDPRASQRVEAIPATQEGGLRPYEQLVPKWLEFLKGLAFLGFA